MTKEVKREDVKTNSYLEHIKTTIWQSVVYLQKARKLKGWTIAQLSKESGVSVGVISDLENGKQKMPSLLNFIALTKTLDMPEEFVIDTVLETKDFRYVDGQGFKCGGTTIKSELKNTLKAYGIHDEDSMKLIMQVIEYAKTRTKNKKA